MTVPVAGFAAVAWDVDGTLVNSEPRHHRALLAASRLWRVDLSDWPDQAFRGVHMGDVWTILRARYPASLSFDVWLEAINAAYVSDAGGLDAMPHAVAAVDALTKAGFVQVCVSNSNRCIVDANLAALGIGSRFAARVTLDDVVAGKPDPEPYLTAARLIGIEPRRIVAVEDSETGLASARAAGLYGVHYCPDGPGSACADAVIASLEALPALLRGGLSAGF